MNNTISTKDTKYSKKKFKESLKIRNSLNNTDTKEEILNENVKIQDEFNKYNICNTANLSNRKIKEKRKNRNLRENKIIENRKNSCIYFLESLIMKSLPLEDNIIELNKDYINEQFSILENSLFKENSIDVATGKEYFNKENTDENDKIKSPKNLIGFIFDNKSFNPVIESSDYYTSLIFNLDSTKESYKENYDKLINLRNKDLTNLAEMYSTEISSKILNTIKEETNLAKFINENKENLIESKLENSLFKNLMIMNTKEALKENKAVEANEKIMNISLAESTFQYTILECLNSLGIDFNTLNMQKSMNRFLKDN